MDNLNYELSPIAKYRAGTPTDPYIKINGQQKVINQRIQLPEIPVDKMKVLITGYVEADARQGNFLSSNQYKVDYNEGIVHFAPEAEGQTITYEFYGKGTHYIASSRVWIEHNNGEVTKTLKDIVDTGETALENIEKLNKVINEAETVITEGNLAIERIDQTNQTVTQAESLRVTAEDARVAQENVRETNEEDRQATELLRDTAEEERKQAETIRKQAETTREANEDTRIANENIRLSQEATRQAQEETRQTQEQARQDSTEAALSNLQDKMDKIVFLGEYVAAKQYYPWNCVSYNGSSYICMKESFGIAPTNTTYWNLLAQKGIDGTGTGTVMEVKSSNGDIIVDNATTTPTLTLNVGEGANQIVKRDADGNIPDIGNSLTDITNDISQLQTDVDTIQADVTTLQTDVGTLETGLTELESTVTSSFGYFASDLFEKNDESQTFSTGVTTKFQDVSSPIEIKSVKGKTLVNLIGKYGNALGQINGFWGIAKETGSPTFDNTGYTNMLRIITDVAGTYARYARLIPSDTMFESGKYYVGIARVKCTEVGQCHFYLTNSGIDTNKTTDWENLVIKFVGENSDKWLVLGEIVNANVNARMRDVRIYEVSSATYNSLTGKTNDQIAEEFPYVDGIGNVKNPYMIVYNENLLPNMKQWIKNNTANATLEFEGNSVSIVDKPESGFTTFAANVDAMRGQTYTFKFEYKTSFTSITEGSVGLYYNINGIDRDGEIIFSLNTSPYITSNTTGSTFRRSFTVPDNENLDKLMVIIGIDNKAAGSVVVSNPMLYVGTTDKDYIDHNESMTAFECELASSPLDGANQEELIIRDNGLPYVYKKWGKDVLTGDEANTWSCFQNYTGGKAIWCKQPLGNLGLFSNGHMFECYLQDYFGLPYRRTSNSVINKNGFFYWDDTYLVIFLDNNLTGWGNNYTPSVEECNVFMRGWKMYDIQNNPNGDGVYNRSDGAYKGWAFRHLGNGYGGGTTTPPTAPSTKIMDGTHDYFRVQYRIADHIEEKITQYENGATLTSGANTVKVGSGMVVRELAHPRYNGSNNWYINRDESGYATGRLKNKAEKIIKVYRDQSEDIGWSTVNYEKAFGMQMTVERAYRYHKDSNYYVTYEMREKGLSTIITGTARDNTGGVVDKVPQEIEDVKQRVSSLEITRNFNPLSMTYYVPCYYVADSHYVVYLDEFSVPVEGLCIAFRVPKTNTVRTPVLDFNARLEYKDILKPNGNPVPIGQFKENGVYTLRYSGTAFILQGEGGEYGTATASDVLAGKTIGTENGLVTGTIPICNADTALGAGLWGTGDLAVYPNAGYRKGGSGAGEIRVTVAQLQNTDGNFRAENIRQGTKIYGVTGTLEVHYKASGSVLADSSGRYTVSGLSFTPTIFYASAYSGNFLFQCLSGGSISRRYSFSTAGQDYAAQCSVLSEGIVAFTTNGFYGQIMGAGNKDISWTAYA